MDEPQEAGLGDQDDEDDDEGGEEVGLVVEDGDGLVGGADFLEPVELAHFVLIKFEDVVVESVRSVRRVEVSQSL